MNIRQRFDSRNFLPQVDIDQDESSGAHVDLIDLVEAEIVETLVKEEDPIYISSDSDSEELTQTSIAVLTEGSVMDNSNRAQPAKRQCVDVNHVTQQLRYPPPLCYIVPPGPVPPHLRENPPVTNTSPISDQPPPSSSCWQISRTSLGMYVGCPVCKFQDRSGLLFEHLKRHQHQTTEWNKTRPCQPCVDQGDFSTRVAPEQVWSHVLSHHFPSSPVPKPPTRTTYHLRPRPNPVGQPLPTPAPAPGCWELFEMPVGDNWVICRYPPKCQTEVKVKNFEKHMQKVHKVDPKSIQHTLLCQGCKLAVPHGGLSAHIKCQKPPSTPPRTLPGQAQDPEWASWIKRVQMKRKASTPA